MHLALMASSVTACHHFYTHVGNCSPSSLARRVPARPQIARGADGSPGRAKCERGAGGRRAVPPLSSSQVDVLTLNPRKQNSGSVTHQEESICQNSFKLTALVAQRAALDQLASSSCCRNEVHGQVLAAPPPQLDAEPEPHSRRALSLRSRASRGPEDKASGFNAAGR